MEEEDNKEENEEESESEEDDSIGPYHINMGYKVYLDKDIVASDYINSFFPSQLQYKVTEIELELNKRLS